ncbi:MAG: hypothetical protein ABR936_14540 [Bacteroidota bacterium]|jgi:hypothetical protein
MTILNISVILFLLIFASTSAITLLSLIGKVSVPDPFRKQLFRLLILEVVGIITAFVADNLRTDQTPFLSESLLLQGQGNWDWSFPENGWRTVMRFQEQGGALKLTGTTYKKDKGGDGIPIVLWESSGPVTLPSLGKQLVFKANACWQKPASELYPQYKDMIDKKFEGRMELRVDIALRGSFTPDSIAFAPWGIMMNRAWQ